MMGQFPAIIVGILVGIIAIVIQEYIFRRRNKKK